MPGSEPKAEVEVEAVVGKLEFKEDFADPDVNLTHNRERTGHSIVSGESTGGNGEEFVVQARGERPTQIEIVGWVTGNQLRIVDSMVSETMIGVTTDRWLGTAVPEDVRTQYNREYHDEYGMVFEVTISLLAIVRGELPTSSTSNSGTDTADSSIRSGPGSISTTQ